MRYTVSTVLIAAASAIAAGCQSGSTRLQMAGDLKEVGLACHNYKTVYERWPAKLADLAKVISKDDYARVSDGRITFVENLSAPQPDVIVAYETGAPDKGGAVLFADGRVLQLSAEEFKAKQATGREKGGGSP
jgi:hypothetical protein